MWKRVPPSRLLDVDARRICLIKPSALGDVVQTLTLLPVLRERFPRATVSWVVSAGLAPILEGHPQLDEVIRFERRGAFRSSWRLLRGLRERRFDLVFDLQGLLRTGLMAWATGAAVRVGLESAREGAGLACHVTVPDTGRLVPAHVRYWRVAEALGLGDRRREMHIAVAEQDRAWAAERLKGLPGPYLAVHPGARWVTKRWPVEKFAAVAAKAVRRFGVSVVILGSPDEAPLAGQMESLLRQFVPADSVRNITGQTSLKQLAAVLQGAAVLLSNDSGPMHLAAGLGTPVVGVFTCTSPERSGPPGAQHALVATEVRCAASYRKRCPYRGRRHLACLEELATERVWEALSHVAARRLGVPRAA